MWNRKWARRQLLQNCGHRSPWRADGSAGERRQALGRGWWPLSEGPVLRAPTCLQTFFSPSDFKIKNFKKEFKKKKKEKKETSVVKKPIFRMQIRYFRALGLNSVVASLRPSLWTVDCPPSSRWRDVVVTVLHMRMRSQESQGSRGAAPHHFMYFVTRLLALKMLLKNKQKKIKKKKEKRKKTQRRKIPNL